MTKDEQRNINTYLDKIRQVAAQFHSYEPGSARKRADEIVKQLDMLQNQMMIAVQSNEAPITSGRVEQKPFASWPPPDGARVYYAPPSYSRTLGSHMIACVYMVDGRTKLPRMVSMDGTWTKTVAKQEIVLDPRPHSGRVHLLGDCWPEHEDALKNFTRIDRNGRNKTR